MKGFLHQRNDSFEGYEDGTDQEVVMLTRIMHVESQEEVQRERLFNTRCRVQNKICNVIIDSGSCTNVASTEMVEKLNLQTRLHPKPYSLQWLNKDKGIKALKQDLIQFKIGNYGDEVWCDVLGMDAC